MSAGSLPALRDGRTWATGLHPIIAYLQQRFPGRELDAVLNDVERARGTALTALVQARGQELVDLSLYVSHRNYSTCTQPLLAGLLGWPLRYHLPLRARDAARDRTGHLGLASIDATSEPGHGHEQEHEQERERRRGSPASQTAAAAALLKDSAPNIRLAALYDELLGALARQLGAKNYLLSDEAYATVDCVAVGYLALLLLPDMPQGFARDAMRRYPRVGAYVNDLRVKFLGGDGDGDGLPWGSLERGDLPWLGGVLLDAVTDALPPWSGGRAHKAAEPTDDGQQTSRAEQQRIEWWKNVGFVAGGVLALVGYAVWSGIAAFPGMHGEDVQLEDGDGDGDGDDDDDDEGAGEEHE